MIWPTSFIDFQHEHHENPLAKGAGSVFAPIEARFDVEGQEVVLRALVFVICHLAPCVTVWWCHFLSLHSSLTLHLTWASAINDFIGTHMLYCYVTVVYTYDCTTSFLWSLCQLVVNLQKRGKDIWQKSDKKMCGGNSTLNRRAHCKSFIIWLLSNFVDICWIQ